MNNHRFFLSNLQDSVSNSSQTVDFPAEDEDENLYCIQFNSDYTSSSIMTCPNDMPNDRTKEIFAAFNENTILQCGGYYNNNYGYTAIYTYNENTFTCTKASSILDNFHCGNNIRKILKISENRVIVLSIGGNSPRSSVFEMKYNNNSLETTHLNSAGASSSASYIIKYWDNDIILAYYSDQKLLKIDTTTDSATLEIISNYSEPYPGYLLRSKDNKIYAYDKTENTVLDINIDINTNTFNVQKTYPFDYFNFSLIDSLELNDTSFIVFLKNKRLYRLLYDLSPVDQIPIYTNFFPIGKDCIALNDGESGDLINCLYSGAANLSIMKKNDKIISSGITAYCRIPGIVEIGTDSINYVSGLLTNEPKQTDIRVSLGFKPKMIDIVYQCGEYSGNIRSIRGEELSYYISTNDDIEDVFASLKIEYLNDGFIFPALLYESAINLHYIAYY